MRAAEAGSVRDRVQARREELKKRKAVDLLLPTYGDEFGVRYRPIPDDDFDKLVKKISNAGGPNAPSNMDAACDLLIKACECVLVRNGERLEPLVDEGESSIGFDIRLAEFFGFEAELGDDVTARRIVRAVFSPDGNAPLAPGIHANALMEWLQGNDKAIDETLLPE